MCKLILAIQMSKLIYTAISEQESEIVSAIHPFDGGYRSL